MPVNTDAAPVVPDASRNSVRRRQTPRNGDVVASRRAARADVFTLTVLPSRTEGIVSSYPDAIRAVERLARGSRVDGWFTCDHIHYALVARHRD